MPSSLGQNCVYCHKVFAAKERAKSLAVSPPSNPSGSSATAASSAAAEANLNYLGIINYVIPHLAQMFPNFTSLSSQNNLKFYDGRFLCCPCARSLTEAYKGIVDLENRRSEQSMISRHCSNVPRVAVEEKAIQTMEVKGPPPKLPKTNDLWRIEKRRVAMVNKVKLEARKELGQLTKVSKVLRCVEVGKVDPFFESRDKELARELEVNCPILLELLDGIFPQRRSKKRRKALSAATRTAVGLAAFNWSQNCNGFQQSVGLRMYELQAPVRLYKLFSDLGMTVCYKTAMRILDRALEEEEAEKGAGTAGGGGNVEMLPTTVEGSERIENTEVEAPVSAGSGTDENTEDKERRTTGKGTETAGSASNADQKAAVEKERERVIIRPEKRKADVAAASAADSNVPNSSSSSSESSKVEIDLTADDEDDEEPKGKRRKNEEEEASVATDKEESKNVQEKANDNLNSNKVSDTDVMSVELKCSSSESLPPDENDLKEKLPKGEGQTVQVNQL